MFHLGVVFSVTTIKKYLGSYKIIRSHQSSVLNMIRRSLECVPTYFSYAYFKNTDIRKNTDTNIAHTTHARCLRWFIIQGNC